MWEQPYKIAMMQIFFSPTPAARNGMGGDPVRRIKGPASKRSAEVVLVDNWMKTFSNPILLETDEFFIKKFQRRRTRAHYGINFLLTFLSH